MPRIPAWHGRSALGGIPTDEGGGAGAGRVRRVAGSGDFDHDSVAEPLAVGVDRGGLVPGEQSSPPAPRFPADAPVVVDSAGSRLDGRDRAATVGDPATLGGSGSVRWHLPRDGGGVRSPSRRRSAVGARSSGGGGRPAAVGDARELLGDRPRAAWRPPRRSAAPLRPTASGGRAARPSRRGRSTRRPATSGCRRRVERRAARPWRRSGRGTVGHLHHRLRDQPERPHPGPEVCRFVAA